MNLFYAALACLAVEAEILGPPGPGWTESGSTGDYKSYVRDIGKGQPRQFMLKGVVDAPAELCFEVVTDYDSFAEFMPFVQYTRLLESQKQNKNTVYNWVFFLLNPPMVAKRFYTIRLKDQKNLGGEQGVFRSAWTLEKGERRRTYQDPEIAPHVKTGLKKPVEAVFNDGYWLFEPLDDEGKTLVTYYVSTDPGGSIPAKIADQANAIAMSKLWKAFTERLKKRKAEKSSA